MINGFSAIEAVLNGTDISEKESLLLCLDKYFDPWFGLELPDKEKVEELLQRVVLYENTLDVKEYALHLLTSYSWPPFEILQNNLDKIEPEILANVLYAINMDKDNGEQ